MAARKKMSENTQEVLDRLTRNIYELVWSLIGDMEAVQAGGKEAVEAGGEDAVEAGGEDAEPKGTKRDARKKGGRPKGAKDTKPRARRGKKEEAVAPPDGTTKVGAEMDDLFNDDPEPEIEDSEPFDFAAEVTAWVQGTPSGLLLAKAALTERKLKSLKQLVDPGEQRDFLARLHALAEEQGED